MYFKNENVAKNVQNLAQLRDAAGFWKFWWGSDDFIMQEVYLLRFVPVCVASIRVSCLFLSFPPNYKWSIIEQVTLKIHTTTKYSKMNRRAKMYETQLIAVFN
jgi:hypothetical protein